MKFRDVVPFVFAAIFGLLSIWAVTDILKNGIVSSSGLLVFFVAFPLALSSIFLAAFGKPLRRAKRNQLKQFLEEED